VCRESGEEIMEAAAGIMFAARWCGDLPELLLARTVLEHKFGSDFAATAKEGTGMVDPMVSDSNCLSIDILHI
jgi:vacuolar protein sorting-associated protein IST1